ncbi:olfactory receptor 14C36-like [Buteo buteo]|uniref:olfactory receptor 14C36-like n=1 Tax=Buteo buteo TaxID=30397 RepID=UPI003EB72C10
MVEQRKVILMANSFSDRRKDSAGNKCLSPAEGENSSDLFRLFHSSFPWSPRDPRREPRGGRESAALGWSCAAELCRAPGAEGAHDPRAQREQMSNSSSITQFLLLAFADTWQLQLLHFGLFLGIYLAALMGNGLIITTIACDHHLHTPMYFFLLNLSLLDLGCISTTLPKVMANSLWDTRAISYLGCAAQAFLLLFFISAEYFLLTIMAYDRYIAICKPLHYGTLLGSRVCVHMAAAAWGSGCFYALLHTANTFSVPLCQSHAVDQFFCEIPQILKLACSDAYLREFQLLAFSAFVFLGCFVFIVLSYVQIFRAVLMIPSEQGRHKAFSTCLPHLAVVSLFLSTAIFACLKPPSLSSPSLNLLVAVLYSVVPPAVNPLIYSMRNQDLKDAVWKWMMEFFQKL